MKLYEVIAGILNIDPASLSEESNALNTPNWDSLQHIEIMLAVENAFSVRFSMPETLNRFRHELIRVRQNYSRTRGESDRGLIVGQPMTPQFANVVQSSPEQNSL